MAYVGCTSAIATIAASVAGAARRTRPISSRNRISTAGVSTHTLNGAGWLIWMTRPFRSEHMSQATKMAASTPTPRRPVSALPSA